MEKKLNIDKLYFGVMMKDFNSGRLKSYNLFDSVRVRRSVAMWVLMDAEERKNFEAVSFCFGDVRGRVEYELLVSGLLNDNAEKTDIYRLYVKPNADYLMSLVNSVSIASAKRCLKEL